jgi:uncharacterized protein YdeI (YjbR/CyaY-like superfamily)
VPLFRWLGAASLPSMEMRAGLSILSFPDADGFAAWMAEQPEDAAGLWLRLAKGGAGLTRAAAIDAALCSGWIDGQADRYDERHWLVRFTPRRARSRWSEVNRRRAEQLIAEGRMTPRGLAEVERARGDGRWEAAYPPASTAAVPPELQAELDANPAAAAFFATLTGANRYAVLYRVATAKKPETRARKAAAFAAMLARSETVY